MTIALASQLREGTKKAHTMAENTGFVGCFLKGVVDKNSYRKLLADLYFVYQAMEEEIDRLANEGNPIIKPILYKELHRVKTIEEDLNYYYGNQWQKELKPSLPAKAYTNRIHEVARVSPELLIGHHYTRYLGDLSGGQILKKIAQKAMNLNGHDGIRFYEFDDIDDEKAFKKKYSATLNSLPIDQSIADSIVEEANYAFKCNMDIFQELEGNLVTAIGKVLFRFLTARQRPGSTENV